MAGFGHRPLSSVATARGGEGAQKRDCTAYRSLLSPVCRAVTSCAPLPTEPGGALGHQSFAALANSLALSAGM